MSAAVEVWVGTRKGAFAFRSKDRKKWQTHGPYFGGEEVHHVAQDRRKPERFYAVQNQSRPGATRPHNAIRREHSARKDVSLNEISAALICRVARLRHRDHLEHRNSPWSQSVPDSREVGWPIVFAHRLKHFDGYDTVISSLHVPVVQQTEIDRPGGAIIADA